MLTFSKARQLAESWIEVACGEDVELIPEATITKPYGWVFFYQSSAFLKKPDALSSALAGNAPFVIDRIDGEIKVLGTALPVEDYLREYERTLPPNRLTS